MKGTLVKARRSTVQRRTPSPSQNGRAKSKYIYVFGAGKADGRADMKPLLGGKGANLAEMTNLGVPVPPGVHYHRGLPKIL